MRLRKGGVTGRGDPFVVPETIRKMCVTRTHVTVACYPCRWSRTHRALCMDRPLTIDRRKKI